MTSPHVQPAVSKRTLLLWILPFVLLVPLLIVFLSKPPATRPSSLPIGEVQVLSSAVPANSGSTYCWWSVLSLVESSSKANHAVLILLGDIRILNNVRAFRDGEFVLIQYDLNGKENSVQLRPDGKTLFIYFDTAGSVEARYPALAAMDVIGGNLPKIIPDTRQQIEDLIRSFASSARKAR